MRKMRKMCAITSSRKAINQTFCCTIPSLILSFVLKYHLVLRLVYCHVYILEKYFYTKQLVNFAFIPNFEKCSFIEEIISTVSLNKLLCRFFRSFGLQRAVTCIAYRMRHITAVFLPYYWQFDTVLVCWEEEVHGVSVRDIFLTSASVRT